MKTNNTVPTISLSALKIMVEKELKINDISDKCRSRELAQARFIYFKLSKKFCPIRSLSAVGREVKRDHATVINGLKKWDTEIIYDPYMEIIYNRIASILSNNSITVEEENNALYFQSLEERISKLEERLIQTKELV